MNTYFHITSSPSKFLSQQCKGINRPFGLWCWPPNLRKCLSYSGTVESQYIVPCPYPSCHRQAHEHFSSQLEVSPNSTPARFSFADENRIFSLKTIFQRTVSPQNQKLNQAQSRFNAELNPFITVEFKKLELNAIDKQTVKDVIDFIGDFTKCPS